MHAVIMMSTLFIYKTIDSLKEFSEHTKVPCTKCNEYSVDFDVHDFAGTSFDLYFFFVYPHKYLVKNLFNIYKLSELNSNQEKIVNCTKRRRRHV